MTIHQRRRFWLKLAAGLLFAVVAYGGAYLACVREPIRPTAAGAAKYPFHRGLAAHYYGPSRLLEVFFAPANEIDRLIRPSIWRLPP